MSFQEGNHPLFLYSEEEKQEIRKELEMKDSEIREDVEVILAWFQMQPHLAESFIDRDFIERMLIIAKGSREKTKRRIDSFYKYRRLAPELISREIPLSDVNEDIWTFYRQAMIPKLYEGKRISVIQFTDPNPNAFFCDVLFRNTLMLADLRLKYDYMLGDIWILDLKHTGFGHLLRISPTLMQKVAHILQDGLGLRIYAIHVVNVPSVGQQVLAFMKQFMQPKILDRVMPHANIDDLHKYIPKEYLPMDYGGYQPSMEQFKEKTQKELRSGRTKQVLLKCTKQVSNESRRSNANHLGCLAGTFKKLDID